jgi:hypothetical protein
MDPHEIFRKDKLLEFWPTSFQSAKDRVAATTRFVIYAMSILYLIKRDARILALGILVLAALYFLYTNNQIPDATVRPTQTEGRAPYWARDTVTMPTIDNPMGNVLMTDYVDNPDRPPAAWAASVKPQTDVVWDFIHPFENKKEAQRNFYSPASTTIPNDQNAFAEGAFGAKFSPFSKDGSGVANVDSDRFHFPERPQMRAGNGR